MGFAIRIRIPEGKTLSVEVAIKELQDWVETIGGYEKAYQAWRLVNHLCVVKPAASYEDDEVEGL